MGRYNGDVTGDEYLRNEDAYGNPYTNVRNNSSLMLDNTRMSQDGGVRRSMNIVPDLQLHKH